MDFLATIWLGTPVWIWLAFVAVVILLLVFDLGVLHREAQEVGVKESLWMSAFYIGLPAEISLTVTAMLLAGGVVYPIWKTRFEDGLKKTP